MKRATRSSKRLQVEMEVEDHPSLASFIQENLSENKPHLSPLAARAALASLMSTTHKHAAMEGTRLFDCSMSDDITMTMKLSSRMSAAPVVSESVKLVNPLRPTKGLSSGILVEEPKTENTTAGSGLAISDTSLTCSMKERKLSQSTNATRITRAAAQRGAEQTKNDLHGKTCAEALESKASNSLRRLTRSAVNKGMFTVEDKQESKENNVALVTKSDFSEGKVTIFESSVWKKKRRLSEKKKQVPSPVDAEITIQAEEGNREEMSTAVETSQKIEGKILNNGTSSQGQKRKTISHGKKEERRFSPQLKSLLHTC